MRKMLMVGCLFVSMLTIILPAGVFAAALPVDLSANDLIKGSGPAVYLYALDGKRYVFPTEAIYKSWFSDFSKVKTLTDQQLAEIDLGGNMVVRPGTNLVKVINSPAVYAVEPKGKLALLKSEAAAYELYGLNWSKMIIDIPEAFWLNYSKSDVVIDGTKYPQGQIIKYGVGTYYINPDYKRALIANMDEFNKYDFDSRFIMIGRVDVPDAGTLDQNRTYVNLADKANSFDLNEMVRTDKIFIKPIDANDISVDDASKYFASPLVDMFFTRDDVKTLVNTCTGMSLYLFDDEHLAFVFTAKANHTTNFVGTYIYNEGYQVLSRVTENGYYPAVMGRLGESIVLTSDAVGAKYLYVMPKNTWNLWYVDGCATGTSASSTCTATTLIDRNK